MSGGSRQSQLSLAALAGALVVGSVGYFLGISRLVEPQGYRSPGAAPPEGEYLLAPTQAGLASSPRGPNVGRIEQNFAALAKIRRGLADEVGRPSDAEWDAAMAARAERRAFNGAPPVIPHEINQGGFPNCLACHEVGMTLEEGLVAPAMSHAQMASCTQCHVVSERPIPGEAITGGPLEVPNAFAGLDRAGRGERAYPGAPPTIPHTTWLRERCESCHGVLATGLRSSHACQQNCQQCHAPSSGLDQTPRTPPSEMPLASLPGDDRPPPLRPSGD